jgi:uncharacterized repeat protein (TIGR03803 family)
VLTTLYSFCSQPGCTDGYELSAGLIQAAGRDFYGATLLGGDFTACPNGCGTIFKVTSGGALMTLHAFQSTDGAFPGATLVQAADGDLYGTTGWGGTYDAGTVFRITPRGTLSTVHSFCSQSDCADGGQPNGGLVLSADGNLYGTTQSGGSSGLGTAFRMTPGGKLTTLHNFCSQDGCLDSYYPTELIQALDGSFYGATSLGGANGLGTIFRLTSAGEFTTLYSFCSQSGCADGEGPLGGLVQATDGYFYGTTCGEACTTGLDTPKGTIFRMTPGGVLRTLYSFCSQDQSICPDGANPAASLVQDTNGSFYGTTVSGGANGFGTIFSLSVGLGPFVETEPGSGKVGRAVNILGTNLAGATSVTFNEMPAAFRVVSASLLRPRCRLAPPAVRSGSERRTARFGATCPSG